MAVLVIDGPASQAGKACRVARQYTAPQARSRTARSGSSLRYVSRHGHAFIGPYAVSSEGMGPTIRIAWKPHTCPPMSALRPNQSSRTRMIAAAMAASVTFKWVAGDTVYGVGDIEQQLRRAGKGYVLGVSSAHVFQSWASGDPSAGTAGTSPGRGARPTGNACRQGPEPKDRGCMIGVISNWPISRPKNSNSANQGLWTRRSADPSSYRRWRSRLLHHLVSSRNIHRNTGGGRRPSVGDRGQF